VSAKMKRREFISLLGGAAAAWPLKLRAQGERVPLVGILSNIIEDDPAMKARVDAFRQELEKFGWLPGRNVRIETRFGAVTPQQLQANAKELLALRPDVILANAPHVARTLQQASRTVPIVFVAVSDPIGGGLIATLARPGGNLTGLQNYEATITGKWLAMLKEIAPSTARAALVGNSHDGDFDHFFRAAESAAKSLAIDVEPIRVESAADIERAIEAIARVPNGSLVLPPDATTIQHRDLIIALAARRHVPAVYAFRFFVTAGGLMSYATDLVDQYRQAARYVNRILRGANPADLPVQAPNKFETVINLKTAKALGLTVPPAMLVAADEVIE
jgi:putative tryptophan/tyrosine transport system substrate-binding protein